MNRKRLSLLANYHKREIWQVFFGNPETPCESAYPIDYEMESAFLNPNTKMKSTKEESQY
jgi:hypothetical protein